MFRYFVWLLLCLPTQLLLGQLDSALLSLIRDNHYYLRPAASVWEGSAIPIIQEAVTNAQFILVGEQHGIREPGDFTEYLYSQLRNEGFNHLALEVSPFMAQTLEENLRANPSNLSTLEEKYPMAYPFYNNEDDLSMLERAVANDDQDIWGLDQVFVVEARMLFGKMEAMAKTESQQSLARSYFEQATEKFNAAMQSGNFNDIMLFALEKEDFEALRSEFSQREFPIVHEMLDQLGETQQIYQAWYEGRGYDNNNERIRLMKKNFYNYYHRAVSGGDIFPQVIFKFGSNHMQKGLTPVHVFDLGNLAHELAIENGLHSVHFLINGLQGEAYNALQGTQPFDHAEDFDQNFMHAVQADKSEGGWHVFDLRPLRQLRLKNAELQLKNLIFGFDFWILVPKADALRSFRDK